MAFITIAGEQLIAQKQGASQVLQITQFILANVPSLGAEPANRIEALPPAGQIVDTQPVTHQGYVNANQVVYSLALDSTIGDYDFNWVGLKSAEGTLIACEHIPLTQKRKTAGPVAGNNLTRNFLLAFSGATATTAIAVPASTWQIDFTTRLLQIDDRDRLGKLDEYGAAAFLDDGFKVSLASGTTYNIAAGLSYVAGIRCEKAALTTLDAVSLPKGIWMDVSLQGDINGVVPVITFSASSAALADNTDGLGFKHYLFKIADIAAGGLITDLRPPVVVPKAEAEAGLATIIRKWTAERVKQAIVAAMEGYMALPLAALDFPTIATADNRLTVMPSAAAAGGKVAIPAGVAIALAQEITAGLTGIVKNWKTTAWQSADLNANNTYYLRAKISNNALTVYTTKGEDSDTIPASLLGMPDAALGGGFDSTVLDILLAKVVTGANASVPVVTALANAARLDMYFTETLTANPMTFGTNPKVVTSITNSSAEGNHTATINWARAPRSTALSGNLQIGKTGNAMDSWMNWLSFTQRNRYALQAKISSDWTTSLVGSVPGTSNIFISASA
jgi:Phage tail-collar fibre protein